MQCFDFLLMTFIIKLGQYQSMCFNAWLSTTNQDGGQVSLVIIQSQKINVY